MSFKADIGDRILYIEKAKLTEIGEIYIVDALDDTSIELPIRVHSDRLGHSFWIYTNMYINVTKQSLSKLERIIYEL